jgi:hypothetical protein
MMVFQRVGLWENSRIMLPVAGISLLTMLLTLPLGFELAHFLVSLFWSHER